MFRPKWTTSRWRLPGQLRKERLRELMAKDKLKPLLGTDFVAGLESRRRYLEKNQWRLFLIQAPLFLFLAFSLLNINVTVSVLGISAAASKSLREVLLLMSSTLGLASTFVNREVSSINELLHAVVAKAAGKNIELGEFFKVRYGLGSNSSLLTFSDELHIGRAQWMLFLVNILSGVAFVLMLIAIVLIVQILNVVEVYRHPNVSDTAAWFVISYVVLGDIFTISNWLLSRSYQPYQTYEDIKKLDKLKETDKQKYDAVISDMVQRHHLKGFMMRLLTRPRLKRLP